MTATNSKKEKGKKKTKKQVLISLCASQGLAEGCAPSLRCCDCSVFIAAGTLSSDPCSPSRAERDAQGASCACRTHFSTLSVIPQRLLLQSLRKTKRALLPFPPLPACCYCLERKADFEPDFSASLSGGSPPARPACPWGFQSLAGTGSPLAAHQTSGAVCPRSLAAGIVRCTGAGHWGSGPETWPWAPWQCSAADTKSNYSPFPPQPAGLCLFQHTQDQQRRKHPLVSQLLIMALDIRRAQSKPQLWSPGGPRRALKSASASPAAATKARGSATAGSLQGTGSLLSAPCPKGTIRSPWGTFLNSR